MYQKRMYVVIVSAILILLSITFQGTYTYFVASVKDERENTSASLKAADLGNLVLAGNVSSENLWIPGESRDFTFTVTNDGTSPMCFNLIWKDITNEFVNTEDLVVTLKDSNGNVLVEAKPFPTTNENTVLIEGLSIPGKQEGEESHQETYTLTITYTNTELNQIGDMNQQFQATLTGQLGVCKNSTGEEDNPTQEEVFPDVEIGSFDDNGNGVIEQEHGDYNGENADEFQKAELRYIGPNPNNYVKFNCDEQGVNCELWRIIGLVNTPEGQRIKLIRKDYYIEQNAWDSNQSNDWTNASLKEELNGTYYNNFSQTTKSMIDTNITWNLGGPEGSYRTSDDGLVSHWYSYERNTKIYNKQPSTWKTENGKIAAVGLIYPSDYGYAINGGSTQRELCFKVPLYEWKNDINPSRCAGNDWLSPKIRSMWTLTPYMSLNFKYTFAVFSVGNVMNDVTYFSGGVWPVVYLESSVQIETDGDVLNTNPNGSELHPFILNLNSNE